MVIINVVIIKSNGTFYQINVNFYVSSFYKPQLVLLNYKYHDFSLYVARLKKNC